MSKKIPSMSSRKLSRLLEQGGAVFVRQGSTDHGLKIIFTYIDNRKLFKHGKIDTLLSR